MSDSSDSESEQTILMYLLHRRSRSRRSIWVREIYLSREQQGEFFQLGMSAIME